MISRRQIRRYVSLVLEALVYALVARLTTLVGRDDDLWVFGARGGECFEDNSKYLFLYVAENRPSVRPVWVTRDRSVVRSLQQRGYEAYHVFSLRGWWFSLRAGVVFLTHNLKDLNRWAVGGAYTVNLWHGLPLKYISWDAELADLPPVVRHASRYLYDRYDCVPVPGSGSVPFFTSGFDLPADRFPVAGYPRTDALFRDVPGSDLGVDEAAYDRVRRLATDHEVVFYLPTFRSDPSVRASRSIDYAALDEVFAAHDAYLVLKFHPAECDAVDTAQFDHLVTLPAKTDAYPFLSLADALVTDYSSILFDFLLTDAPMIFYAYDLDDYRSSRGFYVDYDEVTPGPVVETGDELCDALDELLSGVDHHVDTREAVRERYVDGPRGDAAETVYETISDRLAR